MSWLPVDEHTRICKPFDETTAPNIIGLYVKRKDILDKKVVHVHTKVFSNSFFLFREVSVFVPHNKTVCNPHRKKNGPSKETIQRASRNDHCNLAKMITEDYPT